MSNNQENLNKFFKKIDLPKWYTGISEYQVDAIRGISDGLQDDFEQGTGYRVERCLKMLGLHPLIGMRKINSMVQHSQGNDLAFLFFILEGYYKTCHKNGVYSTNEKLLMIAVARIDLLPTLKELDRILPPPQPRSLYFPHLRGVPASRVTASATAAARPKRSKATKKSDANPYSQRLRRPVINQPSFSKKEGSNLVVDFPFWAKDGPPNYGESGDDPWFSKYKLSPGRRAVKRAMDDAVDKYFQRMQLASEADTNKASRLAYKKAKQQPLFKEPTVCETHRAMLEQAQLRKDELTVKARDRCLEMIDPNQPKNSLRRKRILDQLEFDIEECLRRYHQGMCTDQVKVQVLKDHISVACEEALVKVAWPEPGQKEGRALEGEHCCMAHTATTETFTRRRLSGGRLNSDAEGTAEVSCRLAGGGLHMDPMQRIPIEVDDCDNYPGALTYLLDGDNTKPMGLPQAKPVKCSSCDYRSDTKYTKKIFFRATDAHKPHSFRFHQVLQSGQPKPYDLAKIVTRSIVKALDKAQSEKTIDETCSYPTSPIKLEEQESKQWQLSNHKFATTKVYLVSRDQSSETTESLNDSSNHSTRSHVDLKAEIVDAVSRCAKGIYTKKAAIKRAEMERTARAPSVHSLSTPEVLHYDIEYFNPDDNELMDRLLADGMRELKKNHRFVLASLPDAHKLPVLRQWIKRRYGKVYSHRELQDNLKESLTIFDTVAKLQNQPPLVDKMGLSDIPELKQNYAYHDQAMAEAERVRSAYYGKLNSDYLEQMTGTWYAMGNYLYPGGPPRKTFYAYMASNHKDILRVKS